jgi:membrane protease YdiL (CAAX protease family)
LRAPQFLFTDTGALRAPWRIVVFAAASLAAFVIADAFVGPLVTGVFALTGVRGVSNAEWTQAAAMLGGTAVSVRWIDKRPWSDVWLGHDAARPGLLTFGFAVGALAIAAPIALLIAGHWLREVPGGSGSWWGAAVRLSLFLLPAALIEELTTRGYLLSVLREAWGWPWAIGVTSVGFGLLHLANNGASVEPVLLVTTAGIFLALVLYVTRSLYAAWMAHFAWNWTMAVLFHTAVSGYPLESPRYRYVDAGPDWATGGEWGPEGGVPAGLGMGLGGGIAYLFARRGRARRREET